MTFDQFQLFNNTLKQIVGKSCWTVQAGNVGSMASLHFGEKISLDKPLPFPNRALSKDEHRFRGEFILYVEDCPWRIESSEKVLASWLDSNRPRGPIVTHMKSRIGKTVTNVDVSFPGLDLTIQFDDGIFLRVFPDQIDPSEGDNYSFQSQSQTFVIAANSTIYIE